MRSQDIVCTGTRRSSLSPNPRPSWFKALTHGGRRADQSCSPARPTSDVPEVSEKLQPDMSGLPATMGNGDSPLSGAGLQTGSAGLPMAGTQFLSSGELVSTPVSEEGNPMRRPSVRFQPDIRGAVSSPDVRVQGVAGASGPAWPSLTTAGEDAGVTRSKTMPVVFTEVERVRAEEGLRKQP
ncbi:hypothetical protein C8Q80DRAFT_1264346 [Daedaleopsis nitida]|nr:hypothetical protein C8Q80DRAFT_1264346 [Daedaleopsis nitida]